jgi:hypothetical protein
VSQESTNRSFDDLARALAEGSISRRRALKLFAGTAIAALIPSRALADDDECVRVCHVPFNRETEEECDFANAQTRCVSRRERRRHLENHPCDCRGRCANCLTPQCLPNGDTCMANDQCCSGICEGEICVCSPEGSACTGGTQCCSGNCSNGFCCPSGYVRLSNGTCAKPCTTDADCPPPGEFVCLCVETTGSGSFCGTNFDATFDPCMDNSQCTARSGELCNADPAVEQCVQAC